MVKTFGTFYRELEYFKKKSLKIGPAPGVGLVRTANFRSRGYSADHCATTVWCIKRQKSIFYSKFDFDQFSRICFSKQIEVI